MEKITFNSDNRFVGGWERYDLIGISNNLAPSRTMNVTYVCIFGTAVFTNGLKKKMKKKVSTECVPDLKRKITEESPGIIIREPNIYIRTLIVSADPIQFFMYHSDGRHS